MNFYSKSLIRTILKEQGKAPLKRFGQNFLIDAGAARKVLEAANLSPDDVILEIGPGLGSLTASLAEKVKRVVSVEKDKRMVSLLEQTLAGVKNVEIVQGDALKVDLNLPKGYKIVANLPFYLTARFLRVFLETDNPPQEMVLIIQKEVGQRICAKPPKMNILAASVQYYAKPKIISYISKKSFWPSPKVDSAIIKLSEIEKRPSDRFFKIMKAGFTQPRKQLVNNLSRGLHIYKEDVEKILLDNGIDPTRRAETLSVEDWSSLVNSFKID